MWLGWISPAFRRYVEEVGNEGKLDLVKEIFDSYLSNQPDGHPEERGPEDVKRFIGEFRQAIPDFHSTIEEQIAEGDKVVTRWTIRGRQQGESGASPPAESRSRSGGWGSSASQKRARWLKAGTTSICWA